MITTSTGAKKLESSDNWREIFPNPGTSAAGAHNASVDAQDRIQAEVAPIINGKRCSLGAASGEYVLLRNSTIAGKTDGAYQATKAIPANTDLDSTYLGSPITGGMVNSLNNNFTKDAVTVTTADNDITTLNKRPCFIQNGVVYATIQFNNTGSEKSGQANLFTMQYNSNGTAVGIGVCADGTSFTVAISNGTNILKLDDGKVKTGWSVIHIVYLT